LKATGGLTYITVGDLNKAFQSANDHINLYAISHSGSFPTVHTGLNFSAELLYNLNEDISLGLGIGYFRVPILFDVSFNYGTPTNQTDTVSAIAIPITLNLHYSFTIRPSLKVFLTAGTGYYLTKINFEVNYIWDYGVNGKETMDYIFKSGSGAFGLQGGLGVEYQISSGLSLIVEVLGRYAKVSNFKGDWTSVDKFNGTTSSGQGSDIYFNYFEYDVNGKRYSDLHFGEDLPARAINVRRGNLDLTGFSPLIGIKYSFGKK
jgi:opacity protein-like surface antigen